MKNFNQRVNRAFLASLFSRVVSILVNLIQMALLFEFFAREAIALFLLMIGAQFFVGILEFGFGQTLQRRIAYVKGKFQIEAGDQMHEGAMAEINGLIGMASWYYRRAAFFVFMVLSVFGSIYLLQLEWTSLNQTEILSLWLIVCLGYVILVYSWFFESTLHGIGEVSHANLANSFSWLAYLVLLSTVLYSGGSLLLVCCAWVLRIVFNRIFSWLYLKRALPKLSLKSQLESKEQLIELFKPSLKWWLSLVATFLISGSSRYWIGFLIGADAVPDFQALFLALSMIQIIAISFVSIAQPYFSQMWKQEQFPLMKERFVKLSRLGFILLGLAYAFIFVFADHLFRLWLGEGHYLGDRILCLLMVALLLEAQHSMLNVICIAAERLEFYKICFVGGLLSIGLYIFLLPQYGLLGAVMALLLSHLLTNNWYIPMLSLKLLQLRVSEYMLKVLLPATALVLFGFAIFYTAKQILGI